MFPVDIISPESESVKDAVATELFSYGHTKMFSPLSIGCAAFQTSSLISEVLNHGLFTKLLNRMEYIKSL